MSLKRSPASFIWTLLGTFTLLLWSRGQVSGSRRHTLAHLESRTPTQDALRAVQLKPTSAYCSYDPSELKNGSNGGRWVKKQWPQPVSEAISEGSDFNPEAATALLHDLVDWKCWAPAPTTCGAWGKDDLERHLEHMSWDWAPAHCDLLSLDDSMKEEVLHALANKTLILVGDSLQGHMYKSLSCMFGKWFAESLSHDVSFNNRSYPPVEGFRTSQNFKVYFARHNFLLHPDSLNATLESPGNGNAPLGGYSDQLDTCGKCTPYGHLLNIERSILVVNTGAHWTYEYVMHYREMARKVQEYLKAHFKGDLIYFRTTPTGHTDCLSAYSPLDVRFGASFNWASLTHLDRQWVEVAEEIKDSRMRTLDVYLTNTRADGHLGTPNGKNKTDCLHYCQPGVVDIWNQMLLTYLYTDFAS